MSQTGDQSGPLDPDPDHGPPSSQSDAKSDESTNDLKQFLAVNERDPYELFDPSPTKDFLQMKWSPTPEERAAKATNTSESVDDSNKRTIPAEESDGGGDSSSEEASSDDNEQSDATSNGAEKDQLTGPKTRVKSRKPQWIGSKLKKIKKRVKKSLKYPQIIGPVKEAEASSRVEIPAKESDIKEQRASNEPNNALKPDTRSRRKAQTSSAKPAASPLRIRFHAFVCPDIAVDPQTFRFGVVCDENKWNGHDMKPLQLVKVDNMGYVAEGEVQFDDTKRELIEYKYSFECTDPKSGNKEFFIEYRQEDYNRNRRFFVANHRSETTSEIYDGIIFPPDEPTKPKTYWEKIKGIFKNAFTLFSHQMGREYEWKAYRAMFYELDLQMMPQNTQAIHADARHQGESLTQYTKAHAYLWPIYRFFKTRNRSDFFVEILNRFMDVNKVKSVALASAILGVCFEDYEFSNRFYMIQDNNTFNSILESLNLEGEPELARIFDTDDSETMNKLIQAFEKALNKLSYNKRSVYLLELYLRLKFGDAALAELYAKEENKKAVNDLMASIQVNSYDNRLEIVTGTMEDPSDLLICYFIPRMIYDNEQPWNPRTLERCSLDKVLYVIESYFLRGRHYETCLHEDRKPKSLAKFIGLIEASMNHFFSLETSRRTSKLLSFISERCANIASQDNEKKFDEFLRHIYAVWLIAWISKANVFCLLQLLEHIQDEESSERSQKLINKLEKTVHRLASYLQKFRGYIWLKGMQPRLQIWVFKIISVISDIKEMLQGPRFSGVSQYINIIALEYGQSNFNELDISHLIKICAHLKEKSDYNQNLVSFVLEAIKHNIDGINQKNLNELEELSKSDARIVNELATNIIISKWPHGKREIPHEVFKFAFEYFNFLLTFISSTGRKNLDNNESAKTVKETFSKIFNLVESTCQGIRTGDVQIELIKLLNQSPDKFTELIKHLRQANSQSDKAFTALDQSDIENLLKLRMREISNFEGVYAVLIGLEDVAKKIKIVDSKPLQNELALWKDLNKRSLAELCSPLSGESNDESCAELDGRIKPFAEIITSKPVIEQFLRLTVKPNLILDSYLKQQLEQHCSTQPLSVPDFVRIVIQASLEAYRQLGDSLVDGSYVLESFDRLRTEISQNRKASFEWKEEIRVLLEFCRCDSETEKTLIKKLDVYQKLKRIKKITGLLLKTAELAKLSGSLSTLSDIHSSINSESYGQKTIGDISTETINVYDELESLSEEDMELCLAKFIENYSFIEWLKETAPSLQKLKILAELASESENEGALEIVRCQSLTMVCTAYGPLIYELKADANYTKLLEMAKKVQLNLKKNPNLPEKISIIAKEKSWLEDVKHSKGNTEASTLKQGTKINQRGIYEVSLRKTSTNLTPSVSDVVRLHVERDFTIKDDKEKHYSYSELTELHDKLTLVVGKNQEHQEIIGYFEDIFEGVVKIAEIFVNFLKSGNVLFKNWSATIYCNERSDNTIKINFGSEFASQNIFGNRLNEKSTLVSINKTIEFLQGCYQDWIKYVNEKREEFVELNQFRTEQIVMLCTELAKLNSNEASIEDEDEYLDALRGLLFNVNREIDLDLLREANDFVRGTLRPKSVSTADEHVDDEAENAAKLEIKEYLSDMGYSARLIKASLTNVQSLDKGEHLRYCADNEANELKLEMDKISQKPQEALFESVRKQLVAPADAYEEFDEAANTLEDKYSALWSKYRARVDDTFREFISISHLGRILDYLKCKSATKIRRIRPPYLDTNAPNLIICPEKQIILRALSLYLLSPDQPMPTNDEILYCNAATSCEQIELFWKRMFTHSASSTAQGVEQKIYCLMNVHDLAYDQAVKSQLLFDKLIEHYGFDGKSQKSFTLCIFCSSEKENKSVYATAFSRYKRTVPLERDAESKLKAYLAAHLKHGVRMDQGVAEAMQQMNVRVVTSDRAGAGKSLYVRRLHEDVARQLGIKIDLHCIPIKKQTVPFEAIFERLTADTKTSIRNKSQMRLFHLDIAYEVWNDVDAFLFGLVCMSFLVNEKGQVWRRSPNDLLLIEIMAPRFKRADAAEYKSLHTMLDILPTLNCQSPSQVLEFLTNDATLSSETCPLLFDNANLKSEVVQRPCQYLRALEAGMQLDAVTYMPQKPVGMQRCLELLLKHSEIANPSWSELLHFATFLNIQLKDAENSVFCDSHLTEGMLQGFKTFVVRFMVQMSHDFALPSLDISDRSALQIKANQQVEFEFERLEMRRRWETDPHPYLFFNPDGHTFTFFGFYVDQRTGQLLDPNTDRPLFEADLALSRALIDGINLQDRNILRENIATMSKTDKIRKLLGVMGKDPSMNVRDPDPSYELTMDNLLKMLAIYMRFRANIPVIVMGETGCGKTRLCEYLCELEKSSVVQQARHQTELTNMYLVKVHGGMDVEEIVDHVNRAQALAAENSRLYPGIFTVLFFDEANSTEAIGTIKEIMCDGRMQGRELATDTGLKIIAACNPYRKHAEETIASFEKAGLGFYVDASETQERLGDVPMRHLVYRVQPLPAAMLPIIWDFGQLNDQVEQLYIKQIVRERFCDNNYAGTASLNEDQRALLETLICASQAFLRKLKNESSYVSLRDIQRFLSVFQWFYEKGDKIYLKTTTKNDEETDQDKFFWSAILALNTCYHVGLPDDRSRLAYRQNIAGVFDQTAIDEQHMLDQIDRCYEVFLDEIQLPDAIARNQALKENVFMMILCIELKIPLFIIGKPGSSKSLAKTLIAQKMQGADRASSTILSDFKEAQLITFQCSPLSTSEMILKTFRHCAKYQYERQNDLDRYTSVVVLDEIGLAEASPSMPLKALHPLLEKGVFFSEKEQDRLRAEVQRGRPVKATGAVVQRTGEWQRVGFIGISNWVLDPAKMNRGIFVNRCTPDVDELKETVQGICKNDEKVLELLKSKHVVDSICDGYLRLCEAAKKTREFFGLRDFYSLVKMIYWSASRGEDISWTLIDRAIKRNFGGLIGVDPTLIFKEQFARNGAHFDNDSADCSVVELIQEALLKKTTEDESRYLLLLAQNDNALDVINGYILNSATRVDHSKVRVIFGSSFPSDQNYSQICRKIHQIKLSMELGQTVILLNLEHLYESLYDALNQFYYRFSNDEKFVDLGLGTQRVKCLVHDDFKLIVIADKADVYDSKKYPIPLVNRLEKHLLTIDDILSPEMKVWAGELSEWSRLLARVSGQHRSTRRQLKQDLKPSDIFVGLTEETIPSLVFKASSQGRAEQLLWSVKRSLLQCATADAIVRLLEAHLIDRTLTRHQLDDIERTIDVYFNEQLHDNFRSFCSRYCLQPDDGNIFIQITTNSKLLSARQMASVAMETGVKIRDASLLAFDSQQQFRQTLKDFYETESTWARLLIIQCECGHFYKDLISCARFTITDEYAKYLTSQREAPTKAKFKVALVVQIPRMSGDHVTTGLQTANWFCYHIDDLQDDWNLGNILSFKNKSLGELFSHSLSASSTEDAEGFERPADSGDDENRAKNLKMLKKILNATVYTACSKISDDSTRQSSAERQFKSRTIARVELLLGLMQDDGDQLNARFVDCLLSHVTDLQLSREADSLQFSRAWIFNEVSKLSNVIRYGTLKSSCHHYVENRLGHLLAGLVCFLDTNGNLDLLDGNQEWLRAAWIRMFESRSLVNLSYAAHFLQANGTSEKSEFQCTYSSNLQRSQANDKRLQLKLPFSWLIKDQLDQLAQLTVAEEDEALADPVQQAKWKSRQLESAFETSRLYEVLLNKVVKPDDKKYDFVRLYLNDFLLLSVTEPFLNAAHLDLAKKRVFAFCESSLAKSRHDLTILVSFHVALAHLQSELKYLNKLVLAYPHVLTKLNSDERMAHNLALQAAKIVAKELNETDTIKMVGKKSEWQSWFERVKRYATLVEKLIATFQVSGDAELFSIWQRIMATRYVFEHVSYLSEALFLRCLNNWKLIGSTADFRTSETFVKFRAFIGALERHVQQEREKNAALSLCNGCRSDSTTQGRAGLFKTSTCTRCQLCKSCCDELKAARRCPGCRKSIEKTDIVQITPISAQSDLYHDFKASVNWLYMDVVSNLCFADRTRLPEPDVVTAIIGDVMPRSRREMSGPFDLSSSPSIKSTMFQLLLNYSAKEVEDYLAAVFSKSAEYLRINYEAKDLAELNLMYINSIEDSLYAKSPTNDSADNLSLDSARGLEYLEELVEVISAGETPETEQRNPIDDLRRIAKMRFVLTTYAKLAHLISTSGDCLLETEPHKSFHRGVKDLIKYSEQKELQHFLIKQIYRRYGKQTLIDLAGKRGFKWLAPIELINSSINNLADSYVVCGKMYLEARELVREGILSHDYKKLVEFLKYQKRNRAPGYLAIYKELVLPHLIADLGQPVDNPALKELAKELGNNSILKEFESSEMVPTEFVKAKQMGASLLLMHVYVVLSERPGVLRPFADMLKSPGEYRTSFLPTMPDDDIYETLQAIKASLGPEEALGLYHCPNKHPYTIGDCTQPNQRAVCNICQSPIGGLNYRPESGNERIEEKAEEVRLGYFSKPATERGNNPEKVRNMSLLNSSLVRLILDCVLYLASIRAKSNAKVFIADEAEDQDDVKESEYFYEQVIKDLAILSQFLQHSSDEVLLLVHHVIDRICLHGKDMKPNALKTKAERADLERQLCAELLDPILGANLQGIIRDSAALLEADLKTDEHDQLFRIAFDRLQTATEIEAGYASFHLGTKQFWSFRQQVTIEHMANSLLTSNLQQKHPVLHHFVELMPQLQAIRFLPSLAKLAKLVHTTFNRQIERVHAHTLSVQDVLDSEKMVRNFGIRKTLENGARDFIAAWNMCSKFLNLGSKLAASDLKTMPLALLLCNRFSEGRYIYALLKYLIELNNHFVDFYAKSAGKETDKESTEFESLTANECVAFVPEKDVLQIVFMNSNYSLSNAEHVNLEYNFAKIEDAIQRNLLNGRMRIDANIRLFEFAEDINEMNRFEILNQKVPQSELPSLLKEKLVSHYQQPNQLSETIRKIRIVIDFVASSGCPKETKILDYAVNVLKMSAAVNADEATAASQEGVCKELNDLEVVHLRSLWELLNFRRVLLLTWHGHDPFEQLSDAFKSTESATATADDWETWATDELTGRRRVVSSSLLFSHLGLVHHFITYKLIGEAADVERDRELAELNLRDVLVEYLAGMKSAPCSEEIELEAKLNYGSFKVAHVLGIWRLLARLYAREASKKS